MTKAPAKRGRAKRNATVPGTHQDKDKDAVQQRVPKTANKIVPASSELVRTLQGIATRLGSAGSSQEAEDILQNDGLGDISIINSFHGKLPDNIESAIHPQKGSTKLNSAKHNRSV